MMLEARMRNFFFDRERVIDALGKADHQNLSKAGAFVRTRARSSIRKRKASSTAGSPPSSHTDDLKKRIFFAYDPTNKSVVVGPEKTNQVFFAGGSFARPVRGTVPEVLEEGGDVAIAEVLRHGRWQRMDLRARRQNAGLQRRVRTVHYDARPYMVPAMEAEKSKFPSLWAGSVH